MSPTIHATDYDPALAMARQALYRFAALSLLDPQFGSWERLSRLREDRLLTDAAAWIHGLPRAVPEELALGEESLGHLDPAAVLARLPDSRDKLNEQYEHTFGLLVSNACPPYETEYINSKYSFQRSNALADVSGFFRAFGVRPSRAHPERPDHIVHELEFMALLIDLARQADSVASLQGQEWLDICGQAQSRFLRDHLSWWAPAFARLLARENPGGFYETAGTFLAALIAAERALAELPPPHGRASPSGQEQPDACEGCPLGP